MNRIVSGLALASAPVHAWSGETTWYALRADGALIGHATHEVIERPDGRDVVERQVVDLANARGSVQTSQRASRREDLTGRVVAMTMETRVGRATTRTSVRIDGKTAYVSRQTAMGRTQSQIALPPDVRFDDGEALLPGWDPKARPVIAFAAFDPDGPLVGRVTIEAAAPAPGDPPGVVMALRKRYDGGELRGVARLTLDARGRIVAVAQPVFGATMVSALSTQAEATAPHPPYAALRTVAVKSPYRISDAAAHGHIRYRFGFRDGLAFAPPETAEQQVVETAAGLTMDICRTCGPAMAADAATLAEALKPTPWLQTGDARIRRLVIRAVSPKMSDARKMDALLQTARPIIEKIDFTGHYSAAETLQRRAGDCTEAAVLLATLGRAAGVPTKVVNGLVYARAYYHGVSNAFMPHSWTLAYVDGRWRSYDLALDEFESTHIALTVGDGDAGSVAAAGRLAGLLVWDGMTAVRTPGERE